MKSCKQLTQAQRYQIEILKKAGKENKAITALVETAEVIQLITQDAPLLSQPTTSIISC